MFQDISEKKVLDSFSFLPFFFFLKKNNSKKALI